MHWQQTKIACWLLSFALFCNPGHAIGIAVAFPVSDVPVSDQEEEETARSEVNVASHPARRLTVRSLLRVQFLPPQDHTIREQSVASSNQPLCERTLHKGVGTHLRL